MNNENRIKNLKKEIEVLKTKVDKERSKLKLAQQKSAVDPSNCLPVDISINTKFALNVDEAAYALSIEIQVPIDLVILRSPVQLDLIDTDLGSSVVSVTPQTLLSPSSDGSQDYRFVATYRSSRLFSFFAFSDLVIGARAKKRDSTSSFAPLRVSMATS